MASSDTDISLSMLGIYYSIYNILLVCINQWEIQTWWVKDSVGTAFHHSTSLIPTLPWGPSRTGG